MSLNTATLPVSDGQGNWWLPAFPNWRFPSDRPLLGEPATNSVSKQYGTGSSFAGLVEAHHITNIPTTIPNLGVPGTSLNIATLLLDGALGRAGLPDVMAALFSAQGFEVLAVVVWEQRDEQSVFGINLPDLLGYEIEIFTVAPAAAMVAPAAQPAVIIGIGVILVGLALFVALDALVPGVDLVGGFADAIDQVVTSVSEGVADVVQAPFSGAAFVLLAGIGTFIALGFFLDKGNIETKRATAALAGGTKAASAAITGPGTAARSVQAVRRAAAGR